MSIVGLAEAAMRRTLSCCAGFKMVPHPLVRGAVPIERLGYSKMEAPPDARFKQNCARHLQHLKLKGQKRPGDHSILTTVRYRRLPACEPSFTVKQRDSASTGSTVCRIASSRGAPTNGACAGFQKHLTPRGWGHGLRRATHGLFALKRVPARQ